jgi:hypothetical protein
VIGSRNHLSGCGYSHHVVVSIDSPSATARIPAFVFYMVVLALEIGAFLASPLVECCLRFVVKLRRFCQLAPELEL